jgi:hypothetical protein
MHRKHQIVIGWIDPGVVDGMFALSMMEIFAKRSHLISNILRIEAGGLLSRARNEIAANFMDSDADWLFMIDSDEAITVADFDKLVETAHDKLRPFVAGVYYGAANGPDIYPEPVPLIFRDAEGNKYFPITEYPENAVIPITAAGTGCILVHRSVLAAIQERATEHQGPRWCWFLDLPVGQQWFGEDMYFCRQVHDLGFPMVAHTGVQLLHRKRYWLGRKHFERFQFLTREDRSVLAPADKDNNVSIKSLREELAAAIEADDKIKVNELRNQITQLHDLEHETREVN